MSNLTFNISGGLAPYYVTLAPDEIGGEHTYNNPQQITFSDIPTGTYTLTVIDSNGCEVENVIDVP